MFIECNVREQKRRIHGSEKSKYVVPNWTLCIFNGTLSIWVYIKLWTKYPCVFMETKPGTRNGFSQWSGWKTQLKALVKAFIATEHSARTSIQSRVGRSENGSHNVPHVVINDPVPIPALIGKYWTRDENIRKSTITRGSGGGYTKQEMYEYIQLQSV